MKPRKGLFIVLEGTDRVGKSTQAKLLAETLSGIYGNETYLISFPDRSTVIGKNLSNYLSGKLEINPHAVHLLFTANRWIFAIFGVKKLLIIFCNCVTFKWDLIDICPLVLLFIDSKHFDSSSDLPVQLPWVFPMF